MVCVIMKSNSNDGEPMDLTTGSSVYGVDGSAYRLGGEIAEGGQGAVWSLEGNVNFVAKFHHHILSDENVAKLSTMCRLRSNALSNVAARPISLLKRSMSGKPEGFLKRRISEYHAVHLLYGVK
jgi:DNA-binding helix-hairpin-helix protein with protein kinase domain